MRYLGLILDGRWSFTSHLAGAAKRAGERAAKLGRLLPNLGGPDGKVRRLYANTVKSVALYGASVWAPQLAASRHARASMARAFRPIAARISRAYRTVAYNVATVIAGLPPMEYAAEEHYNMFLESRDSEGRLIRWTANHRARRRLQHRRRAIAKWREVLVASGDTTPGLRVVGAIRPLLDQWVDRGWGGLSFRMTQVLTGHGCFGHYLCRIGREQNSGCHHCPAEDDTAQHTLGECPAWA
ncbi:PREDICTED: uncharacterized protein LOC105561615, partial [Vollenhovia emeryi]|uniref:uncharacterized protein LOC105561615 n=1 Tax=Vollenhovia emeryi TaxID=411798 RepID=UPI0005F4DADA